jgi:hypothetical protein
MPVGRTCLAACAAALIAAGAAQAAPNADFAFQTTEPCFAGRCVAAVDYDTSVLEAPVTVEIDWDARDSAGAFRADATLTCQAPSEVDYAPPCTARSPVYREPAKTLVAVRVTDSRDGSQATSQRPLVVQAPGTLSKPGARGPGEDLCAPRQTGVQCGPGNGRRTAGGGEKVPHNGWPAVTGILWKVLDSGGHNKTGGPDNDELLGHHGSDKLKGGPGHDILWGDWDPDNNNTRQRDVLDGGAGNDWLYPSHGSTVVRGGPGRDYVWAYYGRGTIDCGPGKNDTARVRLNGPWKVHNCERILHFCAFGSDGHGGCLKPGEKRKGRAAWIARADR